MLLINNEIDLGKSFDKLAGSLLESEKLIKEGGAFSNMQAYVNLKHSVINHLNICIDSTDSTADDIPEGLFNINS